jgi:Tol biopolymer transport system component
MLAAGVAAVSQAWKGVAQTSLGTLTWVEAGSLWTREVPDGSAMKVVSEDGLHSPRFSSSGRWLAYRSRRNKLSVVRSDGQSGASLDGEDAVWFPRDDRLAVTSHGDVSVFAPESGWKSPAAVVKGAGLPVFGPDGERFVFAWHVEKDGAPAAGQLCLASVSAPKRKPEVLVSNSGSLRLYGWTHDGKSILYWCADDWSASIWNDGVGLYLVPVEGGSARKLGVSTLVHDDIVDLAPKSAGNQLAVTSGDGRATWAEKRIAVVDLETGSSHNVTREDIAAICPTWSPDGRRIAYVAAPDAEVAYRKSMAGANIRIMRGDGTVETRVVTPDMKVAPGGGEPAHVFLHQRKIWLVDASGTGQPRQLTSDSRYRDEEPLWSPDGGHILFGRMDYEGQTSLWLMESSGSGPVEVCRLQISDALGNENSWFGFYGYTDWRDAFDWRRHS